MIYVGLAYLPKWSEEKNKMVQPKANILHATYMLYNHCILMLFLVT